MVPTVFHELLYATYKNMSLGEGFDFLSEINLVLMR